MKFKLRDLRISFRLPSEQNINSLLLLGQKLSLIVFSFLTPLNYWFVFGVIGLLIADIEIEDELIEGD